MNNPFTLAFGKKPVEYISRIAQTDEILSNLNSEIPSVHSYMITGVRGSGKTVMLSEISSRLREEDWIVVDLNPAGDMLKSLASKLYTSAKVRKLFIKTKFDFSALGIGISFDDAAPVTDYETAISMMLEEIGRQKKRVLLTIDEVVVNSAVREMTSAFQIFVRNDLPVFLLMTGLYENVNDLQNEKSLTFLYRAPKIEMGPLNRSAVAASYQKVFEIDETVARYLAAKTMGFPFAYQALGYLFWNRKEDPLYMDDINSIMTVNDVLPEYDQYLQEFVYEKIWSELSPKDKEVMRELAKDEKLKVKELREKLSMSSPEFSVYRSRLKRKGLISTDDYGYVALALPRFGQYVLSLWEE